MTTEDALNFLRANQPLPDTKFVSDAILERFNEVRKYFQENPHPECVELLLGALGKGDGHGTFSLVEDAICNQDRDTTLQALEKVMAKKSVGLYWHLQIASNYAQAAWIPIFASVLSFGDTDERFAAVAALGLIGTEPALEVLQAHLLSEKETDIREFMQEILDEAKQQP
jgi:hypothetical protein